MAKRRRSSAVVVSGKIRHCKRRRRGPSGRMRCAVMYPSKVICKSRVKTRKGYRCKRYKKLAKRH